MGQEKPTLGLRFLHIKWGQNCLFHRMIERIKQNPVLKEQLDKKEEELTHLILHSSSILDAVEAIALPFAEIDRIRREPNGEHEARQRARNKVLEEYQQQLAQEEELAAKKKRELFLQPQEQDHYVHRLTNRIIKGGP